MFTTEKKIPNDGIYTYDDIIEEKDNWEWFTEISQDSPFAVKTDSRFAVNIDDLDLIISDGDETEDRNDEIPIVLPAIFDIYIIRIVSNDNIEER